MDTLHTTTSIAMDRRVVHPCKNGHALVLISFMVLGIKSVICASLRSEISLQTCTIISANGRVIDLYPLAKLDGTYRFTTEYSGVTFNFNPCLPVTDTGQHISKIFLKAILPNHDNPEKPKSFVLGTKRTILFPRHKTTICDKDTFSDDNRTGDCPLTQYLSTYNENTHPVLPTPIAASEGITTQAGHANDTSGELFEGSGDDDDDTSSLDESESLYSSEYSSEEGSEEEEVEEELEEGSVEEKVVEEVDEKLDDTIPDTILSRITRANKPGNITGVLGFRSKGRCNGFKTHILLQCDPDVYAVDNAQFKLISADCPGHLYFMVTHRCCCEDLCHTSALLNAANHNRHPLPPLPWLPPNRTYPSSLSPWIQEWNTYHGYNTHLANEDWDFSNVSSYNMPEDAPPPSKDVPRLLWLVAVVNFLVVGGAVCIAGVCCRKGSSFGSDHGPYNYLPALHGSRMTIGSSMESFHNPIPALPPKSAEYLDYSSPLANQNKLPLLTNCVIPQADIEIGQRLGGGVFSDTYLAEWKDRPVAAKRLTAGVHQGHVSDDDRTWIVERFKYISRQRHKHLVSFAGICLETRQLHVITEYIECESLKDALIKRSEDNFSWTKKIKICTQAAEGLQFLHCSKPPILHRDVRCANILIDRYDKVKVVDHGMTSVIQRLRQSCNGRKECYCKKSQCALPASLRWTAPELLCNPQADEDLNPDVINPTCDVYSYGMLLWETASHCDPFEDIPDENELMQLVIDGVRPRVDILHGMIPHLKELMKACWVDTPEQRPTMKQVLSQLKTCSQVITKMSSKSRSRNTSSTYYLKSALNMQA